MSRGPGKIERAIADAFTKNPQGRFFLEQLTKIAYPNRTIEKKHKIVTALAAYRAAKRLGWQGIRTGRDKGQPLMFISAIDEDTYVYWRTLAPRWWGWSDERTKQYIKEIDEAPLEGEYFSMLHRVHNKLQHRWWRCESQIARFTVAGETAKATELQHCLDHEREVWRNGTTNGVNIGLGTAILNGKHLLMQPPPKQMFRETCPNKPPKRLRVMIDDDEGE